MAEARFSRRTIHVLLAVCLLAVPGQAEYSGGTGEPNDPYQIAAAEDLIALGETPEDYDKHFILTTDIDLDPNLPGRKVFDRTVVAPGSYGCTARTGCHFWGVPFAGVFDGNGHTISHLTITGNLVCGGLIGGLATLGQVRNLAVVDVNITGTGGPVGSIVGCSEGAMTDCHSSGQVSGGGSVGGLVGGNHGIVTQCDSTATVSADEAAGGLVGANSYGTIVTSHSSGTVTGRSRLGGLVGVNLGTVTGCHSSGTVTGNGDEIGGLVGHNTLGTVIQCYSAGTVSGIGVGDRVGGLAGMNYEGQVTQCYSLGTVTGQTKVGGLLGQNQGTVTQCYSAAIVDAAAERAGGLVGSWSISSPYDPAADSFWDTETFGRVGRVGSAGGTGKTTAEMQEINMYLDAGWDFVGETANGTDDIWWILEGQDYPHLWWELLGDDAAVLVIDDFEDYNAVEGHEIFMTWLTPFAFPINGAMVGHMTPPFAETTIVHGGSQSMPFYYDNTDGIVNSWAFRTLDSPQDWTANDTVALVLWFRGIADNDVDMFHIAVNGTTVFNPDPNAVLVDTWTPWIIPLSSLAAVGVNTEHVTSLQIGVGDKTQPSQNASGLLYIDDIRVVKRPQ